MRQAQIEEPLVWLMLHCPKDLTESYRKRALRVSCDRLTSVLGLSCKSYSDSRIDVSAGTAHAAAIATGPPAPDAIVELDGEAVAILAAPDGALKAQAALSDVARFDQSAVLAGTGHVFGPDHGVYLNAFFLQPIEGLSVAKFGERWKNGHRQALARMVETEEGVRSLGSYTQLHADTRTSRRLTTSLGWNGTIFAGAARSFTDRPQTLRERLLSPAIATTALADERGFIDHARSTMRLYRQIT